MKHFKNPVSPQADLQEDKVRKVENVHPPPHRINPSFVHELRKFGKFNLKGCYNCGTCTLSCELSSDAAPFPRRALQYAILGLDDILLESLEPWLCSGCGDCSRNCPREAEPRESISTIQRYLTSRYDWTGISSRMYRSKTWAIGLPASASTAFLILLVIFHTYALDIPFADFLSAQVGLEHMFNVITYLTLFLILIPLIILASNLTRMFRFIFPPERRGSIPFSLFITEMKTFFINIVTQKKMRDCPHEENRTRWVKHVVTAAGCAIMLVILLFFLKWFQTDNIYPFTHPQRWVGYIATAFLLFGSIDVLYSRVTKKAEIHKFSETSDYALPVLLFLTAGTGILVHMFRYMALVRATMFTFALHIAVAVPLLIIELPFGRWSHILYRPFAMYLHSVREKSEAVIEPEQARKAA